jgi:CrcB protein
LSEKRDPKTSNTIYIMLIFIAVATGGAIGATLRYSLIQILSGPLIISGLPTLVVNVLGTLLLGIFFGYVESRTAVPKYLVTLVAVGVLGGFTTFSSYMYEVVLHKELDDMLWSGLILLATLGLGLLAIMIGLAVGRNV